MPYRSPQNFNNAINNFFFVLPPFMVSSLYKTPLGDSNYDEKCKTDIKSILSNSMDIDDSNYKDYMFQECCDERKVSFYKKKSFEIMEEIEI